MVDESNGNAFRRYRVQKVSEQTAGTYEIIAIKYDPQKFEFVESDAGNLSSRGTNLFSPAGTPVLQPSGITFGVRVNP
jgi:predicted phage tail protein